MGYRSSGNLTVDAMGSIAISGNVIPEEWYKHILKPTTGKPYLLAITILADLVYWHRPTEVRDERTGEVIGWKKKFHGEMLQKSYQEYANKFGESKKTIKLAFDQLVEIGVIKRFFYNSIVKRFIIPDNKKHIFCFTIDSYIFKNMPKV